MNIPASIKSIKVSDFIPQQEILFLCGLFAVAAVCGFSFPILYAHHDVNVPASVRRDSFYAKLQGYALPEATKQRLLAESHEVASRQEAQYIKGGGLAHRSHYYTLLIPAEFDDAIDIPTIQFLGEEGWKLSPYPTEENFMVFQKEAP